MSFIRPGGVVGVALALAVWSLPAAAQAPGPDKPSEADDRGEPKAEPARAEEAPAPADAAPTPAAAPAPAKLAERPKNATPRITVRAYELGESAPALTTADAIEAQVGEVLAADKRFEFKSVVELLDHSDVAPRVLGQADLSVEDAEKSFGEMDLEKSKQLLKDAIMAYQKYLPQLAARGGGLLPLRDAWLKLAKARFFDGDNNGSRDALRYAFVLDPKVEFDKKRFPPQMKKTVIEAKLLFETLGPGKLVVDSDPPGATAYLNGVKLLKQTPTEPIDAQPGPNYISYERRGYAPFTAIFENNGGGEQASAVQSLARYPQNPLAPLDRARAQLDQGDKPPLVKDAAQALGVDLLLLIKTAKTAEGSKVTAYLYDARPDRILKRAEKTVPELDEPAAARELAGEVTSGVRLDGVWQPPAAPKKPSFWARFTEKSRDDLTRFRHWKGFWYVVGGVAGAVVVGAAVGIGVGVGPHHPTAGESIVLLGGN